LIERQQKPISIGQQKLVAYLLADIITAPGMDIEKCSPDLNRASNSARDQRTKRTVPDAIVVSFASMPNGNLALPPAQGCARRSRVDPVECDNTGSTRLRVGLAVTLGHPTSGN
jgi:hypothetical protein